MVTHVRASSTAFETLAGPHVENALDMDSTRPPTSHLKDVLSTEQMDKLEQMIEKHRLLFMQSSMILKNRADSASDRSETGRETT